MAGRKGSEFYLRQTNVATGERVRGHCAVRLERAKGAAVKVLPGGDGIEPGCQQRHTLGHGAAVRSRLGLRLA